MEYPHRCIIKVENIFGENDVHITLNSGITVLVGANGLGKTQTLKALRNHLRSEYGEDKVRYLSSNRIGLMEQYRSKINRFTYSANDFNFGGKDEKAFRHKIETATGDFFTLDDKKDVYIKVAERLSALFKRQMYLRWDSGNLTVFFEKTESQGEYSVVAEASGLVNIISILSALYDNEVQFLLIDEPEVSLHPQLQSYILRELQIAANQFDKTVILSTHSASMIPFEEVGSISNFVFFAEGGTPKQIASDAPELANKRLGEFVLRMSQIYKEGLFAKRVLFVEGSSDLIICKFLLQKLNLNADVAGTQIIPVDGKGQFPAVVKLFRLIGKEIYILTDLDAFTDDNAVIDLFSSLPKAVTIANEHGMSTFSEIVRNIKSTINQSISEEHFHELQKIYETHPYWVNKDKDLETDKAIRRAVIASLFSSSDAEISDWPSYSDWKQLKVRLNTLFDDFEKLGCHILRRGALESYYMYSPNDVYSEKPSSAVNEVSKLQDDNPEDINQQYSDVIRALKSVSELSVIDEGYAVKKELLSELALVLEVVAHSPDTKDLYAAVKLVKGNSQSLFDYSIVTENEKKGIKVDINSKILNVVGFPFKVFPGDNVNDIVSKNVLMG